MVVNGTAVFIPDSIFPDAFLLKTDRPVERYSCQIVTVDMQLDPLEYLMFLHPFGEMQKQFFAHAPTAPVFFF